MFASHGAHIAVLIPRARRHLRRDSNKMLYAILNKTPGSDRTIGASLSEEQKTRHASCVPGPRALNENRKTALNFIVHRRRDARASTMVTRPPQGIHSHTTAMRFAMGVIIVVILCRAEVTSQSPMRPPGQLPASRDTHRGTGHPRHDQSG